MWPLSKLPANRKRLFLPGISEDLNFHNTFQNTSCSLADFFFEWAFFSPEQRRLWLTSEPDSIHTSCRSESSNKSLVVLDKDPSSSQTNWPIENNLDHHWHWLLLIHPPGIKGENIAAQDTIILLSAGQWVLWVAKTKGNSKSWLFIQHLGMQWHVPPGGRGL